MIYLQPHSGLANRIRVIISGLHLADILKQNLTLIWTKDDSLNCDFQDLFETENKIILKSNEWKWTFLKRFQNAGWSTFFFCKLFSIDFCFFDKDLKEFVWGTGSNNIDLNKIPEGIKNYYFYTCHEFYFNSTYFKYLQPVEAIKKRIEYNTACFTDKTIGVHIRRTDHANSIQESPLECFIEMMRHEISVDAANNFFLATDEKEIETILRDLFPGKILTYTKDYSRKRIKGIQDAMVDLYSLSATCKIYGSYFSSFSDIASRIGDIPLIIIRKK